MPEKLNYINYLSSATLSGYKSLESVNTKLTKGLNIIIGHNASGKSNFLNCLAIVLAYRNRSLKLPFNSSELRMMVDNGDEIIWNLQKNNIPMFRITDWQVRTLLESHVESSNEEQNNIIEIISKNGKVIFDSKKFKEGIFEFRNTKIRLGTNIRQAVFRRLNIFGPYSKLLHFSLPEILEGINTPASILFSKNGIEITGFDYDQPLLSFLDNLFFDLCNSIAIDKQANLKRIYSVLKVEKKLTEKLKKYSPIKDVRFHQNINLFKEESRIRIENIQVEFNINGDWMPWSNLSDGTKRLFYLIAEIQSLGKGGIILLEEPELGIHPQQLHNFMNFLKEESQEKQIILSTHSPQVLNILEADELDKIIIAKYVKSKGTILSHLNGRQKVKAKKYMNEVGFLSDYWVLSDMESL